MGVQHVHQFWPAAGDSRQSCCYRRTEVKCLINDLRIQGIAPTSIAFRVAEEKPKSEATGTGPLSRLTFRRSQSNRGHEFTRGILSTLRLGRDNWDGSVTISSVHHLQLNVEAQDNAALSSTEWENEEKLYKHNGIEVL